MSDKRPRTIRVAGVVVLFCVAMLAAVLWSGQARPPWYSILPPLLAIALALLTHRVLLSLGLSVLLGGLLTHVVAAPESPQAWALGLQQAALYVTGTFAAPTDTGVAVKWDKVKIMIFVIFMMATITVMLVSGGLQGIVNRFSRFARGVRSTQTVTALAGIVVFIDDYANSMIVGNSMRPLTDKNRISREKLAFLVDATSAPIAGLALVSTWIGFEVSLFADQARSLGIPRDGYSMFLDAVPFRFYCLMTIAFVLVNAISGKDFGPMAAAERRARAGDPIGPSAALDVSRVEAPREQARARAAAGVIPMVGLLVILIGGFWIEGYGLKRLSETPTALVSASAWREVILAEKDLSLLLAVASGVALLLAVGCAMGLGRVPIGRIGKAASRGVAVSILPALILVLAWSLENTCKGLQTAEFLRTAVGGIASPLWFPPLVFVIAGATAFATGTSWGTMTILIPTATPIAYQLDGGTFGLVTLITLAAVLDGSIFGDHCSPISDTTILSSTASGCDHLQHVRTQAPYAFVIAGLALACGYIPAALGVPAWVGLLVAIGAIVTLFTLLRPLNHPSSAGG